jgi:hypothetical protein
MRKIITLKYSAVLASLILGAVFGTFQNFTASAQDPEYPVLYDGGSGGGSGGGGPVYCPVPSVTVNGRTCAASGCKLYSSTYTAFVCDYRSSDGSSSGCPPLEQCN